MAVLTRSVRALSEGAARATKIADLDLSDLRLLLTIAIWAVVAGALVIYAAGAVGLAVRVFEGAA